MNNIPSRVGLIEYDSHGEAYEKDPGIKDKRRARERRRERKRDKERERDRQTNRQTESETERDLDRSRQRDWINGERVR